MCPTSTLQILNESINTGINEDHLSDYLEQIKAYLLYRRWFFGHFHRDMELPNQQRLIYKSIEELS